MGSLYFPPKPNSFVIGVTHLLGAPLAKLFYNLTLQVSVEDVRRLQGLREQRVIYLVNHPSFNDPIPVMLLSARVKKGFFYMASIEQFGGFLGRYLQRIGSYSVRRGQSDRPSMKETLALISQPKTHLVIFAEGGCSFQNDTVMPFRPGAIQLAFQSMKRMIKDGQAIPDVYVVPLALKYEFRGNVIAYIDDLLHRLEVRLQLSVKAELSRYQRLRAIAVRVIERIEQDYGFDAINKEGDLSQKVEALKIQLLEHCEKTVGIAANPKFSFRERIYQVEAVATESPEMIVGMTLKKFKQSIFRLFNFSAISDGYVAQNPTPERFLDVLVRLEREIFEIDRPKYQGKRWVHAQLGESFNLKDYWSDYERDRHITVDRLIQKAHDEVQRKLDEFPQTPINSSLGLGK